jgi:hypothetical protein
VRIRGFDGLGWQPFKLNPTTVGINLSKVEFHATPLWQGALNGTKARRPSGTKTRGFRLPVAGHADFGWPDVGRIRSSGRPPTLGQVTWRERRGRSSRAPSEQYPSKTADTRRAPGRWPVPVTRIVSYCSSVWFLFSPWACDAGWRLQGDSTKGRRLAKH